jgi:hypothetical protein
MSDTFAFRSAPIPLRRRINRRAVKAVLLTAVLLLAAGRFADWVIQSERASFAEASSQETSIDVGVNQGGLVTTAAPSTTAFTREDRLAQRGLRAAAAAARSFAHGRGGLALAGPAQLARRIHGLTFTDGPSPMPKIVSVTATAAGWGAAARSVGGRCFWILLEPHGATAFGSATGPCTGRAALAARDAAWQPAA